jgi:hypothetical protein
MTGVLRHRVTRDILWTVAAYLIGAVVIAVVGTLIGSFIAGEWWTSLSSAEARATVAWLALIPAGITYLRRRWPA